MSQDKFGKELLCKSKTVDEDWGACAETETKTKTKEYRTRVLRSRVIRWEQKHHTVRSATKKRKYKTIGMDMPERKQLNSLPSVREVTFTIGVRVQRMLFPPFEAAYQCTSYCTVGDLLHPYLQRHPSNSETMIYSSSASLTKAHDATSAESKSLAITCDDQGRRVLGFDVSLSENLLGIKDIDWSNLSATSLLNPGPRYLHLSVAVQMYRHGLLWPLWKRGARDALNKRPLGESLTKDELRRLRLEGRNPVAFDNSLHNLMLLRHHQKQWEVVNRHALLDWLHRRKPTATGTGAVRYCLLKIQEIIAQRRHSLILPMVCLETNKLYLQYCEALAELGDVDIHTTTSMPVDTTAHNHRTFSFPLEQKECVDCEMRLLN